MGAWRIVREQCCLGGTGGPRNANQWYRGHSARARRTWSPLRPILLAISSRAAAIMWTVDPRSRESCLSFTAWCKGKRPIWCCFSVRFQDREINSISIYTKEKLFRVFLLFFVILFSKLLSEALLI